MRCLILSFHLPYLPAYAANQVNAIDMDGSRFDNTHLNVNNYLSSYQQRIEEIEKLVAGTQSSGIPRCIRAVYRFRYGIGGTYLCDTTMPSRKSRNTRAHGGQCYFFAGV